MMRRAPGWAPYFFSGISGSSRANRMVDVGLLLQADSGSPAGGMERGLTGVPNPDPLTRARNNGNDEKSCPWKMHHHFAGAFILTPDRNVLR